jgi:hypothetical protein
VIVRSRAGVPKIGVEFVSEMEGCANSIRDVESNCRLVVEN